MPNYAQPFSQIGSAAGGAIGGVAGAGAGGAIGAAGLGQLLSPLDYPRQALWNLLRSGGRALSGEGTWDDALSAVPGALGAGLAGGLMATGVGAPLGIAAGSVLGALGQGIGKGTGREAFNAPEVSDLTGTEDMLPNMLVGALTDPLTYAGGLGGLKKGAAVGEGLGKQLGTSLERDALIRGPNYAGGAETLDRLAQQHPQISHFVEQIKRTPKVLGEIEPGSTLAGAGGSTLALRRSEGGITQLTPKTITSTYGDSTLPRANIPEMLQAERAKVYEHSVSPDKIFETRAEHAPGVDVYPGSLPDNVDRRVWEKGYLEGDRHVNALADQMDKKGIDFWDAKLDNIGIDKSGKPIVIDSGSISPMYRQTSPNRIDALPFATDIDTKEPGMINSILLKLLGSDKSVQAELAAKLGEKSVQGSPIMDALMQQSKMAQPQLVR